MPPMLENRNSSQGIGPSNEGLKNLDIEPYEYGVVGDMSPGSPLHEHVAEELRLRRDESYDVMSEKHPNMREMDSIMTSFVHLSDVERTRKEKDPSRPVSIVLPVTYGAAQTIQTQYISLVSSNESLHRMAPRGPEDVIAAALAEKVLDQQSQYFKELGVRYIQSMDFLKYGHGAVTPVWTPVYEYLRKEVPAQIPNPITGEMETDEGQTETMEGEFLAFEGNRLHNIDPYMLFPDPGVCITHVQDMTYCGFGNRTSRMRTLLREQDDPTWFNARYIAPAAGEYKPFEDERIKEILNGHDNRLSNRRPVDPAAAHRSEEVHEVMFYVWLIPSEWKVTEGDKTHRLGLSEVPELWEFALAGGRIVTRAQKSPLFHRRIPISIAAPESDGYGCCPLAHLEMTRGVQKVIDFRINAYNAFVMRFYRGRVAVDDRKVSLKHWRNGSDIIPVKRTSALTGGLKDAIMPIQMDDPFNGSTLPDISMLQDVLQRASGATEPLQGVLQARGERRSAEEARGARLGALSRIEKMALLANLQSGVDITYLMLRQTQQYMSQETYIRMVGRWEEELLAEYGKQAAEGMPGFAQDSKGFFPVSPLAINGAMDVAPVDITKRGEESFDTWVQMYSMIAGNPVLAQLWDMGRISKHIARLGGIKNPSDFMLMDGPGVTKLMQDSLIREEAAKGNAIPAAQAASEELI